MPIDVTVDLAYGVSTVPSIGMTFNFLIFSNAKIRTHGKTVLPQIRIEDGYFGWSWAVIKKHGVGTFSRLLHRDFLKTKFHRKKVPSIVKKMSGIYLVLWDVTNRDKSTVLKPTRGGWPHITVARTGNTIKLDQLKLIASEVFKEWANEEIQLVNAYVNSFEDYSGHFRHDVLITTNKVLMIEKTRKNYFSNGGEGIIMRMPHVTFGIYEDRSLAEMTAKTLNDFYLPYNVIVIGVTI